MAEFNVKHYKSTELELDSFLKLPRKAQEMIFDYHKKIAIDKSVFTALDVIEICSEMSKSPIEEILRLAIDIVIFEKNYSNIHYVQQQKINANNKTYYADFAFYVYDEDSDNYYEPLNDQKLLVIECDGHDFHEKTKEQVKKGNERDFNIKSIGYDILHFSGNQIYSEPFECANKILEYADSYLNGGGKNG